MEQQSPRRPPALLFIWLLMIFIHFTRDLSTYICNTRVQHMSKKWWLWMSLGCVHVLNMNLLTVKSMMHFPGTANKERINILLLWSHLIFIDQHCVSPLSLSIIHLYIYSYLSVSLLIIVIEFIVIYWCTLTLLKPTQSKKRGWVKIQ